MALDGQVISGVRWIRDADGRIIGYRNPLTDEDQEFSGAAAIADIPGLQDALDEIEAQHATDIAVKDAQVASLQSQIDGIEVGSGVSGISDVPGLVDELNAINTELDGKQDSSAKLTAVLGTGSAVGLRRQISATTEDIVAIGVANSTSIPTRGDLDLRHVHIFNGAPNDADGVADGALGLRIDGAFALTPYLKTLGAWVKHNPAAYSWAGRPAASAQYLGQRILINDWASEFQCVTYDAGVTYEWIPVGGRLILSQSGEAVPGSAVVGNGATFVELLEVVSPAGLLIKNCRIYAEALQVYVNATATKQNTLRVGGVSAALVTTAAAANTISHIRKSVYVRQDGANGASYLGNSLAASDTINGSTSALGVNAADLIGPAVSIQFGFFGTSPDTAQLASHYLEVTFPKASF